MPKSTRCNTTSAQLNNTSTGPRVSAAAAIAFRIGDVKRQRLNAGQPLQLADVDIGGDHFRARPANSLAVRKPIPCPAAVISTRFPVKLFSLPWPKGPMVRPLKAVKGQTFNMTKIAYALSFK